MNEHKKGCGEFFQVENIYFCNLNGTYKAITQTVLDQKLWHSLRRKLICIQNKPNENKLRFFRLISWRIKGSFSKLKLYILSTPFFIY